MTTAGAVLGERAAAVRAVDEALDATAAGRGRLVTVEGAAGMGKTALLATARSRAAEAGFTVLHAVGNELEADFAYGVARHLLAGAADAAADARRILDGDSHGDPYAVLLALGDVLEKLVAHGPVLMAVDDAQWSDEPSLHLLELVARRVARLPVVVLVAAREDAVPGPLADLWEAPDTTPLRLRPLSADGVRELMAARLGEPDEEFVEACHRATGGSPFLVARLLDAVVADGGPQASTSPAELERLISSSALVSVVGVLADVDDDTRRAAWALAVLGDDSPAEHVAALIERSLDDVAGAVDELVAAGLLDGSCPSGRLAFVHPLVRSAVDGSIPAAERASLHSRAASALRTAGAPPEQVAALVLHTPPAGDPSTVELLRAAARSALLARAPVSSARYLRRALAEPAPKTDVPRLLLTLGRAEAMAGDDRATATLWAAVDATTEPAARARALRTFGVVLADRGDPAGAVERFDDALALLPPSQDGLRLEIELARATACRQRLELRPLARSWLADMSRRALSEEGDPLPRAVLAELAYEQVLVGTPRSTVVRLARAALDPSGLGRLPGSSRHVALLSLLWAEHADVVRDELDRTAEAGDGRLPADHPTTLHQRAMLAEVLGEFAEAEALTARAAEDMLAAAPMLLPGTLALLARVRLAQRDLAGARAALAALGDVERWTTVVTFHSYLLAQAQVTAAEGDAAAALDVARRCARFSERMGTENPAVIVWQPVAARAMVELGDRPAAIALVQDSLTRARRFGAPGLIARLSLLDDEIRNESAVPARRATDRIGRPPTPTVPTTAVLVLGEATVVRSGRSAPLTRDQADRLVRLIAVHRRGLHVEAVVEHLWPECSAASGRSRLRNVLTRVRQRHGDVVVRDGERLALAPDVRVDLWEFEDLAATALAGTGPAHEQAAVDALARYGGDLLPTDPYADWAEQPRASARSRWLELRDHLAARAADEGRVEEAMRLIGPAIDAEPLEEDRLVTAARWLVAAGRRSGAKALLKRARAVCADLGVTPSDDLLHVEDQLAS